MFDKIYVRTGVNIPEEVGVSLTQTLNDAIEIGIKIDETTVDIDKCHFLQFITHQSPDMYSFNKGKLRWEDEIENFMKDSHTPRWSVDSVNHPSPFYEGGGASIKEAKNFCMFDQPGYGISYKSYSPERIIGCTFVIVNEQIIGKVLWSRQYEQLQIENNDVITSTYHFFIEEAHQLPDWALLTLDDQYDTNDSFSKKQYDIPAFLNRQVILSPDDAIKENNCLLPPPANWLVVRDENFKNLIPSTQSFSFSIGNFGFFRVEENSSNTVQTEEDRIKNSSTSTDEIKLSSK